MREGERPPQGNKIPPSSGRPEERGSLFAANFPSDSSLEEVLADFLKEQKKHDVRLVIRTALATGAVVGTIAAGAVAADKVFANEPISEPTPATEDIGSLDSSSFNPPRDIEGLPPHLQFQSPFAQPTIEPTIETKQPKLDEKVNSEDIIKDFDRSNAIKAHGFSSLPPNRKPDIVSPSQTVVIDQLPKITQHTEYAPGGNYDNFDPGINFRLKEQLAAPYTYREVTPNGLVSHTVMKDLPPFIEIHGYVIRKEVSPEGNILLAVEVPGKNGLLNQDDMGKSLLSKEEFTDNRHYDKISGVIVWLKIKDFQKYSSEGYSAPFVFNASWNEQRAGVQSSHRNTNIPEELFKYIKVGDPVFAFSLPQLGSWAEKSLTENYKEQRNLIPYDEALKKYSEIVDGNAATIRRMLEDSKTGGPSLGEQLESKRYTLEPWSMSFVPR